ncbi:helix-turn-helix domain-containing protein [Amycolatopsis granulosa]|uniref:helix-turn-helix domain-containing protein n=1 Tax=Amycolatopsis granulosa TaxID=185684 RepID=UPI00141FBE74
MSAAEPRRRAADVIAERIRRLRASRSLTRERLASRSGISVRHPSALEDGEIASPGLMVLLRVARGLRCGSTEPPGGLPPTEPARGAPVPARPVAGLAATSPAGPR